MAMSAQREGAPPVPADELPADRPPAAGGFSLDGENRPASSSGSWTPAGEVLAAPDEEAVIAAIATVFDPEIPVNIYELGLIYAIDLHEDGQVKVEMTLTAPGCPSAQELPVQVRDAVLSIPGVSACEVETVWDPPWDASRMSEDARLALNMF